MNWAFDAEIWEEPDGGYGYYAAQVQEGSEAQVLAHGVANTAHDAAQEIHLAFSGVIS